MSVAPASRTAPPRLDARRTLFDACGPGVAWARRSTPRVTRWLTKEPGGAEFLAGGQIAIAGPLPFVCSAGSAAPAGLDLLAAAGLSVPADLRLYADLDGFFATLRRLTAEGFRLAMGSPPDASEVDPRHCAVDPEVARTLNDKGRLGDFVPPALVPRRRVVAPDRLPPAGALLEGGRPVVLKAANRLPSGSGLSVRVCRTEAEVERARAEMAGEPGIVVEEHLEAVASVCVHAVVRWDGEVEVLGVAEQVCDEAGRYLGNWLDAEADARVSPARLAEVAEVFRRGAALGYRGFAGVDVALLADGTARVHDLNFRVNGSTAAVCLRAAVERERAPGTIRWRSWRCAEGFDALVDVVARALGAGAFLPLCFYDPSASRGGGPARVGGLVLAGSRDEARAEEERLAAEGLT